MQTKHYLIILLFISSYGSLLACTCSPKENLKASVTKHYDRADVVFTGEVIKIEDAQKTQRQSSMDVIRYTFKITKIFKGNTKEDTITVSSFRGSSACGYSFTKGKAYVVYSSYMSINNKQFLQTDLCTRNQVLSSVQRKEIRLLRRKSKQYAKRNADY
ncbi:hypothetical protein [Aquimarina brevivitae]|uniref:Tissue inhibitor of metalloproteinase n=1 Tax=Aquimarina brevivitae TaxID=323412 RepID=A0A4Q7P3A8_9FLAO|nr:hypothetical protein [Aquimarina brevivitae]RZS93858.1 tissue inhibitor of metalloproteinase [Aquimarina brevivitae]